MYDDKYMDYRTAYPKLAGLDAAALKKRNRELESQLKAWRSQSESLQKTLNGMASSGLPPAELLNQLGGLLQGVTDREQEMAAITAFMEEIENGAR